MSLLLADLQHFAYQESVYGFLLLSNEKKRRNMKRNSFNVLFFIKKAKLLKNGEASVCMRITVNGARVENNIHMSIEPALWNQVKECAKGKSRRACDLNAYIENIRIRLHQIFNELEEQGQNTIAHLLQEKFFGQDKAPEAVRTIIGTMLEHNDQCIPSFSSPVVFFSSKVRDSSEVISFFISSIVIFAIFLVKVNRQALFILICFIRFIYFRKILYLHIGI